MAGKPVQSDVAPGHPTASYAGMVVVMHVKPQTAAALPGLLDALAARGYHQTALDEMFRVASGTTHLRLGPPSWGPHRSG